LARRFPRRTTILTEKLIKYDFEYCPQNSIKVNVQVIFFSRVGETFMSVNVKSQNCYCKNRIYPLLLEATSVRTKQYMYVAHASLRHSKNMLR
jgi:hypothetical protein